MSASLDNDLKIPQEAKLPLTSSSSSSSALSTAGGATVIALSAATCQRQSGRSLLVGRQAGVSDIRIQHGSISRKHAVFYFVNETLFLQDLGGKHGTTVNGTRIESNAPLQVKHGDTILFGNVRESIFTVKLNTNEGVQEAPGAVDEATSTATETSSAVADEPPKDASAVLQEAGQGLTGRAKRAAEIAAMMASLDETPVYQQFQAAPTHDDEANNNHHDANYADKKDNDTTAAAGESQETAVMRRVARQHKLPVTQVYTVQSERERRGASTCLAVDPAGSRFAIGGSDMHLSFYDFGGMNRMRTGPFKTVIPDDGHLLVDLCYSNTGDRILVGTGSVQPKVLNREGEQVIQFLRGDMYVTDQSRTTGHTAAVTGVDWHPLERDVVLTGSRDGSARLWNLNGKTQFEMLVCDKVFSAKNVRGQRTVVTAVCFHPGGREFAVGTLCGSIQIWNRARVSGRPERAVYDAHGVGKTIDSLTFNMDGSKLASRSSDDDTCKVWNARRLSRSSAPLQTCTGLATVHDKANAAFSADGRLLCAGSSEYQEVQGRRVETGALKLYAIQPMDTSTDSFVDPLLSLDVEGDTGPISVKWHAKLNQIFMACSDGKTLVYYDRKLSSKGALLLQGRLVRKVDDLEELLKSKVPQMSSATMGEIITPFVGVPATKRKRDEGADREPERPVGVKHKTGGQAGGNLNFQQFIADKTVSKSKVIAGKDPREALFEYKEGKSYISQAYEGNKETILADKTAEEEEEEAKK